MLTHLERLNPVAKGNDYSYDTEAGAHREIRTILLRKASSDSWDNDGGQWQLLPAQLNRFRSILITKGERKQIEEIEAKGKRTE